MKKGKLLIALSTVILLGLATTACSSSSDTSNKQEQSSSQSSKKEDNNGVPVKEMDKNLASNLEQDKNSANNGDQNASYAKYIDKVTYNSDKQAQVYVNEDFLSLSDDARNQVVDGVNKLINLSIGMSNVELSPEEGRAGNYLAFYTGSNTAIGHSTLSDHKTIKWYK